MSRNRGHRHTTKTETAKEVVTVLKRFPDIKMIAPGEIDPKNRRIMWKIIEDLRSENRAVILTTHHLEEAEALAEK